MSNRTRRTVRTVIALLAALVAPFALAAIPVTAQAADLTPTSTALTIQGGFSFGDPVTYTATVTSQAGTPTGSVTFTVDGGATIASDVPVDGSGVATVTTTATATGLTAFHADFTGTGGFADSSGLALNNTTAASLVLHPVPSVLEISRSNPLKITLTLSSWATRLDGTPVVGEELTFSVLGKQPNLFDFGGGSVICTAVTNAQGYASCGGKGVFGAIVSLLSGGSYVTHFSDDDYGFSSDKAKVIVLGGP
jgi:hypothetical protein